MSNVVIINRGTRTYTLQPITKPEERTLADGTKVTHMVTVKERLLPPGASIETLDDEEAKLYLGYRDIVDAAKVLPDTGNKVKDLEAEIARLKSENEAMKKAETAPVVEPEPASPAPEAIEEKPSKKKGK